MGTYLAPLACDRPAEGQITKAGFEHFNKEPNVVREAVGRLRSAGSSSSSGLSGGAALFEARPASVGTGCSPLERIEIDAIKDKVVILAAQVESLASQCQSTEQKISNVRL